MAIRTPGAGLITQYPAQSFRRQSCSFYHSCGQHRTCIDSFDCWNIVFAMRTECESGRLTLAAGSGSHESESVTNELALSIGFMRPLHQDYWRVEVQSRRLFSFTRCTAHDNLNIQHGRVRRYGRYVAGEYGPV